MFFSLLLEKLKGIVNSHFNFSNMKQILKPEVQDLINVCLVENVLSLTKSSFDKTLVMCGFPVVAFANRYSHRKFRKLSFKIKTHVKAHKYDTLLEARR